MSSTIIGLITISCLFGSALIGTAKSYPIVHGKIGTGTWQQIVLCDFDDRPREREVIVTVVG